MPEDLMLALADLCLACTRGKGLSTEEFMAVLALANAQLLNDDVESEQ